MFVVIIIYHQESIMKSGKKERSVQLPCVNEIIHFLALDSVGVTHSSPSYRFSLWTPDNMHQLSIAMSVFIITMCLISFVTDQFYVFRLCIKNFVNGFIITVEHLYNIHHWDQQTCPLLRGYSVNTIKNQNGTRRVSH